LHWKNHTNILRKKHFDENTNFEKKYKFWEKIQILRKNTNFEKKTYFLLKILPWFIPVYNCLVDLTNVDFKLEMYCVMHLHALYVDSILCRFYYVYYHYTFYIGKNHAKIISPFWRKKMGKCWEKYKMFLKFSHDFSQCM